MSEAQDVLRKAAEAISEKGWHQGTLVNKKGQLCAMGGILTAVGYEKVRSVAQGWNTFVTLRDLSDDDPDVLFQKETLIQAATGRLIEYLADQGENTEIAVWNDATERTAEDVILALKQAAELS
jgi:hypothetical protein